MTDIVARFYPETLAGGFTRHDGTVQFYQRVRALLPRRGTVLDFGAGRGAGFEDSSLYRISLRDLRGDGRRVIGADVDPVVVTNPSLDEAVVIDLAAPLPFPDRTFDCIISDSTFEHILDGPWISSELDRVLKPGGWICARTPNRYGYVAVLNRIVPNVLADRLVRSAQLDREAQDIFPAYYRMNTLATLRILFPVDRFDHASFSFDSEPRYHFNRVSIFVLMKLFQLFTPPMLRTTLLCFIRKKAATSRPELSPTGNS